MVPGALLTLIALVVVLAAEWQARRPVVWLAKPVASTGFLWAAIDQGALETPYGHAILIALCLSWLGDVLLIPRAKLAFMSGLFAFLLGHVAYAWAFIGRGADLTAGLVALAIGAVPAFAIGRWLLPTVPDRLKGPVLAYIVVITGMVAAAVATVAHSGGPTIAAGALAFYASDLAVARQRFVKQSIINRLWGLPTYYGAQLVLASTVAAALPT